jgi:hypothetical protein
MRLLPRSVVRTFTISLLAACSLEAQTAPATVYVGGRPYVNHGLVGVGRMSHSLKDKFGETFGSFSAFAFQPGSWRRNADGTYSGTLFAQPDRGYNAVGTTNYIPRFNKIEVRVAPSPAGGTAQNQVGLTLADTILFSESNGTPMTSLDPTSAGTGTRAGFPALPQAFNGRLSLDAEGIVVNPDGTLWVSDEYGPYIFKFGADGRLLSVIRPPEAAIPKRNGADSFASNNPGPGQPAPTPADPTTGRQNNQGMEGLSITPDGRTMFALLQSAARQDGGTGGASAVRFNTRLFVYDLTGATPTLKGEYVIQLPTFLQGTATRVAAQSELVAVNNTQVLVIARDSGFGRGLVPTSLYRKVLVYDIANATNIAGTNYDSPATPLAPGGVLAAGVVPATRTEWIDMNDPAQLAKFGLKNGPTDDTNNLSEKWEALALVPALDPAAPDDWFLFIGNDNDFLTTQGFQDGAAYAATVDNDSMVLVYRITLPSRLVNLSSRAQAGAGANAHTLGFVVTGARPKTMLIRGVGPSLAAYGVTGTLADPVLAVFDAAGRAVFRNDNWTDAAAENRTAAARAGAFALAEGSRDAAVVAVLDPGVYSVQVSPAAEATGLSLIEIYEVP